MTNTAEMRGDGSADRQGGRLLADHLRRLARGQSLPAAVHVQIRERFASGREAAMVRLALRPLQDLARDRGAPLFVLSPRDCVLICDGIEPADIAAASSLPEPDALLPAVTIRPLIRCYDLSEADDRLALLALARAHAEGSPDEPNAMESRRRPMDTRALADIHGRLKSVRIADLVHRQTALIAAGGGRFLPLFQEVFVSIADLQSRLAPQIDVFGRPALFRYLTEILDVHILKALADEQLVSEHPLSLNLNVRTILSPAFQTLAATRDRTRPLYVEVQISDLLANPAGFQKAARIVREARCQFCIDGLTPLMLAFLDIGTVAADFFKIAWHEADLAVQPPQRREAFAARIAAIAPERVIFTRIETIEALQIAVELGVKRLQGHIVDRLAAAVPVSER